jgi:hypothetical protein
VTVTSPGDYSGDNGTNANAPHLHDYWLGGTTLTVLDTAVTQSGPGYDGAAVDAAAVVAEFRPDTDHVVPQGASAVHVVVHLTPDGMDLWSAPELWVKTAADTNTSYFADITQDGLLSVPSTNDKNDLPHQRLSAWVFEVRMHADATTGALRYKGEVRIHAEAEKGLEIPLYPGHPDLWAGRNEIPLLDRTGEDLYLSDPGDAGCDGVECKELLVPDAGITVPDDAAMVRVTVELGSSPTTLGLSYHGADRRDFERLEPANTDGSTRIYEILLHGDGDGPYAKTSLWEFQLFIDRPVADSAVYQQYHVTATALHGI